MLDPRIYRMGFVAVALAAVVLAFSLTDQPGPMSATLAPDAFNAQNVVNTMGSFTQTYPDRRPGSNGDNALAREVLARLQRIQGWNVSSSTTNARTVDGNQELQTVTAVRAGQPGGAIVIVAHRDALTQPAAAQLSGTATLAIWLTNPFAAVLLVPALHLWMWVVDPEVRLRKVVTVALLLLGLAAPVALLVYYANALGLGPAPLAWNLLLLVAGGHIKFLVVLEWGVILGCVTSVFVIAVWGQREPRAEDLPITVRGPITYAGPGSLGGTESALRR